MNGQQALTLRISVHLPVGQVQFKTYLPELIFYLPRNYRKSDTLTSADAKYNINIIMGLKQIKILFGLINILFALLNAPKFD